MRDERQIIRGPQRISSLVQFLQLEKKGSNPRPGCRVVCNHCTISALATNHTYVHLIDSILFLNINFNNITKFN